MNDLVTLAIPTYNGKEYLAETLDCAISQRYQPLEILIVDDGSKDDSLRIARQYKQVDNRIKIVQNSKNLGLVGNWNRCLKLAKGDWIKFLFQDDLLNSDAVEKMYDAAKRYQRKFVVCRRNFIVEEDAAERFKIFYTTKIVKLDHLFKENTVLNPIQLQKLVKENGLFRNTIGEPTTFFFHRSVIDNYNSFRAGLIHLCDYEFALRVGLNEGLIFLAEELASFRVHGGSESDRNRRDRKVEMDYIDKLLMLHDFVHSPLYRSLRNSYGEEKLVQQYQRLYNGMVRKLGWRTTRNILKKNAADFEHLEELKFSWRQVVVGVKRRLGLVKNA